jgi:hypothetical protein
MEKLVWCQVVADRPSHMSCRVEQSHRLYPLPWPSTPHVDTCPQSRGPNPHKTWPANQGVWPASRPLCPFGLGFGPLGPCVKYTPMVMMILTFGQLYFVIP